MATLVALFMFVLSAVSAFIGVAVLFGTIAILSDLAGSFFVCSAVLFAGSLLYDVLADIRRNINN